MKFSDSVRISLHIFSRNRLRTGLTVLGIAVGIGIIVFLISFGYGLERIALERIANADSLVSIDVTSSDQINPLNDAAITRIKTIANVEAIDPVYQLPGQIQLKSSVIDVGSVWGISTKYFDLEGLSLQSGKVFDNSTGIVISKAVADLLGLSPDEILGHSFLIRFFPDGGPQSGVLLDSMMTVQGVLQDDTPSVYLNRDVLKNVLTDHYSSLKVKVASQGAVEKVKEEILNQGYQAQATIDDVTDLVKGFRITQAVLASLGLVAVFVSLIGMLNTMTISLLERIKEIGVMKAIGATDRDIWTLFLTEAGLIGAAGAILGLIAGVVGGFLFNTAFNLLSQRLGGPAVSLFYVPLSLGLAIVVLGSLIGIMTGIYPAHRGANINPLRALRYE